MIWKKITNFRIDTFRGFMILSEILILFFKFWLLFLSLFARYAIFMIFQRFLQKNYTQFELLKIMMGCSRGARRKYLYGLWRWLWRCIGLWRCVSFSYICIMIHFSCFSLKKFFQVPIFFSNFEVVDALVGWSQATTSILHPNFIARIVKRFHCDISKFFIKLSALSAILKPSSFKDLTILVQKHSVEFFKSKALLDAPVSSYCCIPFLVFFFIFLEISSFHVKYFVWSTEGALHASFLWNGNIPVWKKNRS